MEGSGREKEEMKRIEIEEDREGEHVETSLNYFFDKIGKPLPILKHHPDSSFFSLQTPPCQPLAVSELHRLIFVAHSSGFFVARTKDVMDAAKEIQDKGTASSVQELCLVDVPFANVHFLALSHDSSTLAVSVASCIHFFSVTSLINKELKPNFSSQLCESSTVKDLKWRRRSETSCLVLSNHGKLYHVVPGSPLKDVMENVDAVEWSVKGKFIVVARDNILTILSSKYKEILCITLPFKSWVGDSEDKSIVKVDSIKWISHDSIIVGCFQQTANGKEENYLLQVVRSEHGKITEATSKLDVISFYDLFSGLTDDILPCGSGPYLFLSYLEKCRLAIAANRKNADQHVVLLGWSVEDDTSEIVAVDIERDSWLPRIELQENGDDNLIMGICIDKVSLYGEVKVEVGVEQKKLPLCCVLICVTLEGKLVMFNVASVTGTAIPSVVESALDGNDEEDTCQEVPAGSDHTNLASGLGEQLLKQAASDFEFQDVSKKELDIRIDDKIPTKKDLKSYKNESSKTINKTEKLSPNDTINHEGTSLVDFKSLLVEKQQKVPVTEMNRDVNGQGKQLFGPQSATLGHLSMKTSLLGESHSFVRGSSKLEAQSFTNFGSSSAPLLGEIPTNAFSHLQHSNYQKNIELAKELQGRMGSTELPGGSSQSWSSEKANFSEGSESRSLFSPTWSQETKSNNTNFNVDAAIVPSDLTGKPFHLKDTAGESTSVKFSVGSAQIGGKKASTSTGRIESLPSIRSSQLVSEENFALGKTSNHKPYLIKDDYKDPSVSRQLGNIKEMAKELDTLLECIEGAGGYRDVCTVFQRTSVEALEEGLKNLSEKCRIWKGMMDERVGEVQRLLDKTIQVLAMKIYVEGIAKQASDTRYWEHWNRQKLCSELELKKKHILKLNQELTNRLIELEGHFNTLELNKFGENGGVLTGRRALQNRYASSRNNKSLHSLHNTMTSQLAAAEQLSDCLSKQMAVLSIESPVKQKNVKKELFETIGISYDDSFNSPDATKFGDTDSLKKVILSSGSASTKDHLRRRQLSATKGSDSETARRSRDSLDRSLANFEPTRTTVKRLFLQESQKTGLNKSSSLMDRQYFNTCAPGRSAVSFQQDEEFPLNFLYPYGNKAVVQGTFPKQDSERKSTFIDSPIPSQTTGPILLQRNDDVLPSVSASWKMSVALQNPTREAYDMSTEESRNMASYMKKSDSASNSGIRFLQQSETSLPQKSSVSMVLPKQTPLLPKTSSEMLNSSTRGNVFTSPAIESVKHEKKSLKDTSFESASKNLKSPFSPLASYPEKVSQQNVATSKSHVSEIASSLFSMSPAVSSSPMMNSSLNIPPSSASPFLTGSDLSVAMPFDTSLTSSRATIDANTTVSLTSMPTVSSSPVFPPRSSSVHASKTQLGSHAPPSVSEPIKRELELHMGETQPLNLTPPPLTPMSPKTEIQKSSAKQTHPPVKSDSLKSEIQPPTIKTTPTSIPPTTTKAPAKTECPPPTDKFDSKRDVDAATVSSLLLPESTVFDLKLEPSVPSVPRSEDSTGLASGNQSSLNNMASDAPNIIQNDLAQLRSSMEVPFGAPVSTSENSTSVKNDGLDIAIAEEDEMEEEAPETSQTNELSLGSLGGFGIGLTPSSTAPKANPFGGPVGNMGTSQGSFSFNMTVPSGELFRPASFTFQSPQSPQPSTPTNMGALSGGFGTGTAVQAPSLSGFGQPAQIGSGQQALGSVLGSFGQSRQIGAGLPASGVAPTSGFSGGFASSNSMGGFSSAVTGGGFASLAKSGGGFAGVASGSGGFAGMASPGGGFVGAAAATGGGFSTAGGGFGGFGGQQGGSGGFSAFSGNTGGNPQGATAGFSSFSSNTGGTGKPSQLFTQIRK